MDESFNNVVEGTRQYFMGLPKPAQNGSGQSMWPTGTSTDEAGAAQCGAPAVLSRPPSAAAAPPSKQTVVSIPTRPPSEPLEPEPHIIHKATVMREAAEKRREQPEIEDEEEPGDALSPPSHIIHKPPPHAMPSPAPASAVPSPSPVRPPPAAAPPPPLIIDHKDLPTPFRTSAHRVQTPTLRSTDHYNQSRTDPYTVARQTEYLRYQYDTSSVESGRLSHGSSVASPQPPIQTRHSPQTYARLSSGLPQHSSNRFNEATAHNSPVLQRYPMSASHQPRPHNDRVPPIHHPQAVPSSAILATADVRSTQIYKKTHDTSTYPRTLTNYDRHTSMSQRKYDSQQSYSGYRTTPAQPHPCIEKHHQSQYKHGVMESVTAHYTTRPPDRAIIPPQPQNLDHSRAIPRMEYMNKNQPNSKSSYNYPIPSTSSVRYVHSSSMPVNQSSLSARPSYRSTVAPKANYDYPPLNPVPPSPSRSAVKPGFQNPPSRMTVSVTSLVDQMNQTKQRRESPLDLSVKTVKNSADSSTTQDEAIDSASMKNEHITLQPRPSSSNRPNVTSGYASHKVDFAPDFTQYRERVNASHGYNVSPQPSIPPLRNNELFDQPRGIMEACPIEPRQMYTESTKYQNVNKNDYVPRIDLTRPNIDDRYSDKRIRDDRHILIEDRKRSGGPDASNIPKKIVKYETWSSDSRIDRLSQSAKEQRELMSRPVYSYTSHKKFEAYQNDIKRPVAPNSYRETQHHISHRYPGNIYTSEQSNRDINDYSRHIIQKIPSHRDVYSNYADTQNGVQPADKKVLSILRNSLETKQSFIDSAKPIIEVTDLIVIDDVDDPVIEITDLTKDNEVETINKPNSSNSLTHIMPTLGHHIKMPKAVDSITHDDVRFDHIESKTKSPENDVASRIRTKAELKVMPPSQDNSTKLESNQKEEIKIVPKSQKQHLFNQIREDNLRLESAIINEKTTDKSPEVKSEPMCIDEIEKDAVMSIKMETDYETSENHGADVKNNEPDLDMDWANACDSFMEQLKDGCHKRKSQRKCNDTLTTPSLDNVVSESSESIKKSEATATLDEARINVDLIVNIKQEPTDCEDNKIKNDIAFSQAIEVSNKSNNKIHEGKIDKNSGKECEKVNKIKSSSKIKNKSPSIETLSHSVVTVKQESVESQSQLVQVKEEAESTDDDEPLIKSKILKEKEQSDRLKYELLKELSEKSAYVKLECCDDRMNNRKSIETVTNDREGKQNKNKSQRLSRSKDSNLSTDNLKNDKVCDSSSDSDDDMPSVASRLRVRKNTKTEDAKTVQVNKNTMKSSPSKKPLDASTPIRKSGFGDGSDFHPGWEEELYRYKRSLRMPTRLIAIPRGCSGGPFFLNTSASQFLRGSTSLPDLDPVPLSPAPSSSQSTATDDIYRRLEKHTLDSDLESNSSCSAPNNRLQYDSEASTSTTFSSTKTKAPSTSIVDVLIQKYGKREEPKKKLKERDDKSSKIVPKSSTSTELLPTPSLGSVKNGNKDIYNIGAFRKETVTMFRTAFINNTNGLIGATEEFSPVVLKSRTRTESRVLKQRATIKEVFGDDRPASAPPSSCRQDFQQDTEEETPTSVKKDVPVKQKLKTKTKNNIKRRSSSIRDGLRSTKSLKRNDAKGRMMRLKKRNSLLKSFSSKRTKEVSNNRIKSDQSLEDKDNSKEESNDLPGTTEANNKKRFKRLFSRRKFSSGFDYIRKKKKIIRRDDSPKVRRQNQKSSPNSVHDVQKEIKGWFINKSIGETHLHRAARLGFTDCVAYCLEKMKSDPSAKDNAGFTPLHVAAAKGHVRIARLLLQYGANVSAAAQGGIRPLHEACENSNVEVIRLLLAYGADPVLGTYAGQTPEELAEGPAATLMRLHIADIQGQAVEPWTFPSPAEIIDRELLGCDALSSPPPATSPPPPDSMMEIQCSEAPLPPFYSLRTAPGQPADGLWCLLQDITNVLQIKSKESLLKQIHCGSGSPKELLREVRTQEFLERAQCHQLLCAGEKVNVRASKVALIRVTDKLRQLLKIETVLVS